MPDHRRSTPRTDLVLTDPRLQSAVDRLGVKLVKRAVATAQQRCRDGDIPPSEVADAAVAALPKAATTLRRVVNATGVIVHTNLGRAPLSMAATEAIEIASGVTDVELDLASGRRDRRGRSAMAALAAAVPDAEDVHVVNNGAAALALAACALARGKQIVVARGELVEIGDSFRIPELLASVGAVLREVGTTNRVRLDDYAAVIDEQTAFVLKVHPSNFVVEGFTSSVRIAELAALAVPVVADIGSGLLTPHPRLPDEPNAADTLRSGAALVTASGDKLLGGPQCGLVLGRRDIVAALRRHPLARALRVDKLTLAALEATLSGPRPPVLVALDRRGEEVLRRAEKICAELSAYVDVEAVPTVAAVGGGGAPGVRLPSAAVSLPTLLATPLRTSQPAIVGRIDKGRLLLDLIAVEPDADAVVVDAVRRVVAGLDT